MSASASTTNAGPSIAIIGPGGVGSVFMAHLTNLGHRVLGCARRPFDEYFIEISSGDIHAPAHIVTDPTDLVDAEPVDWLFVGVKGHQTDGASAWFEHLSGPSTTIVTLQNGVEGASRMEPYGNGAHVLPAVVYCAAELVAPGHVRHRANAQLIVPDSERGRALADLFEGSPATIKATDDHTNQAWFKLAMNVVFNGMTALTNKPMAVMRSGDMPDLVRATVEEVFAVARAEGATLDTADVDRFMGMVDKVPADGLTSMLQDRRAGRSTETDAIHGAVTRIGAAHGIPTPLSTAIGTLVKAGDPE